MEALRGEYESAGEAFTSVRRMVSESGRTLAEECEDEIEGFNWGECFTTKENQHRRRVLHLNHRDEKTDKEKDG